MDENASPEPFLGRDRKLRTDIQIVTSPRTPKQGETGIKSVAYFFTSYRHVRWEIVFVRPNVNRATFFTEKSLYCLRASSENVNVHSSKSERRIPGLCCF